MKKVQSHHLVIIFLVIYLGSLVHHAIHEISLILLAGLAVAVWSHIQKSSATPSLLLLHMGVEWIEWTHNPAKIIGWLCRLGHSGADVLFYHHEIRAHKRASWWLWGGFVFLVIFVSLGFLLEIPEEILEILHQFALGGAVGCVGSHLWFHIVKEPQVLP